MTLSDSGEELDDTDDEDYIPLSDALVSDAPDSDYVTLSDSEAGDSDSNSDLRDPIDSPIPEAASISDGPDSGPILVLDKEFYMACMWVVCGLPLRIVREVASDPRRDLHNKLEELMAGVPPIETKGLPPLTRLFISEADRLETAMLNNIRMRFVNKYVKRYVKCRFPKSLKSCSLRTCHVRLQHDSRVYWGYDIPKGSDPYETRWH